MNKIAKVMQKSMCVNILLAILKIVIGFIGKSSALIADGIHSFSDLITDVFAIIGSALSRKPADEEHPFGHGKIEYITSMIISIIILILLFCPLSISFIIQLLIFRLYNEMFIKSIER